REHAGPFAERHLADIPFLIASRAVKDFRRRQNLEVDIKTLRDHPAGDKIPHMIVIADGQRDLKFAHALPPSLRFTTIVIPAERALASESRNPVVTTGRFSRPKSGHSQAVGGRAAVDHAKQQSSRLLDSGSRAEEALGRNDAGRNESS